LRTPLPPRIEGVFFEKANAHAYPEHFYVMRKKRENNVEIEAEKTNKLLNKSVASAGRKKKSMFEDQLYHHFFKFNFQEEGEEGHPFKLIM
jgi:hypothetical protein